MTPRYDNPKILILEDDSDQMELLIDIAQTEVANYIDDESLSDAERDNLRNIQLIKVSNIDSMKKAVSTHQDVILAISDCNTPDTQGDKPHDQLLKTNHIITGQHRAVDILMKYVPDTPIILISSLNRFRRIIYKYYETSHGLNILFVRKSNPNKLSRNIKKHLMDYLNNSK